MRLAPTGSTRRHRRGDPRRSRRGHGPLPGAISAPAEAQVRPGRRSTDCGGSISTTANCSTPPPDPDSTEVLDGRVLPVLTLVGPDADEQSKQDVCPACGVVPTESVSWAGAVATQLSVTLSNLFGDKTLDAAEKKALMFTDSVQDAAHRAGFVQARSHSLSFADRAARRPRRQRDGPHRTGADGHRAGRNRPGQALPSCCRPTSSTAMSSSASGNRRGPPPQQSPGRGEQSKRRIQFDVDLEFGLAITHRAHPGTDRQCRRGGLPGRVRGGRRSSADVP